MAVTFQEFLTHAKPGTKFVYHIGLLMKDRQTYEPWSQTYGLNELHYAALAVWEAQEKGLVYLVQQRQSGIGFGVYIYTAIKRSPSDRLRVDGPDNRGRELFGSFSGPRSPFSSANRFRTIRANADRTG